MRPPWSVAAVALFATLLVGSRLAAATDTLLGIPLTQPVADTTLGASRDDYPDGLLLSNAALQPDNAAAANNWQASGLWWYAVPAQLPDRLAGRPLELQIALDARRLPFWFHLTSPSGRCEDELQWFNKALSARYRPLEPEEDSEAGAARHASLYQDRDEQLLVGLACENQSLRLEYLLPAAYQRAYEMAARNVPVPADPAAVSTTRTISPQQAQILAAQSEALLRGSRERLDAFVGVPLGVDQATTIAPGPAQPLDLSNTGFGYLKEHPLLPGARHSLTADAAGGVLRQQAVLADPDQHHQARWLALLQERFGRPAKNSAKHQIYRMGGQRLVLRHHDGELRISYQDLRRLKQERERLKALADARFKESIKGL